jgi:hypothetical protein
LVHVYWSKISTKENSIFGNFGFPVEMPISAIFLSGIFFRSSQLEEKNEKLILMIFRSFFWIFFQKFQEIQ